MKRLPLVAAFVLLSLAPGRAAAQSLATVAEKSNFTATSKHTEVVDFCAHLAKQSPLVRLGELGVSTEGRQLPLLIIADPPVATAAEAKQSGKLIVLLLGNIHAGEVDGKEALLMLARDVATAKERPLLKDLILLVVPNFNPDGGDQLSKSNRPWQAGPLEVGTRGNAQGFDLNRDFVKLESPEVRALVRCLNEWDPAIVIDTHTTNGTYHRYAITYDGPRHPATNAKLCAWVNETMLPGIGQLFEKQSGQKSYFYGNLARKQKQWETYPAQPRYGIQYIGLRNRIAILSESYVYAPYRDRVFATRDFVKACLTYAAAQRTHIRQLLNAADQETLAGKTTVALRHKMAALPTPVTILALEGGKTPETGKAIDVPVSYLGRCEATLTVSRPFAYLLPLRTQGERPAALETLERHGIVVEALCEERDLVVEAYRVNKVTRALQAFQKHHLGTLEVTRFPRQQRLPAGTLVVRTSQPLGTLAAFLLEPQSEDGLATWNCFDERLKEGESYPVLCLVAPTPLPTGPLAQVGKILGKKEFSTASPDGKFTAFVHKNNLYVADAKEERQLTKDGAEAILNGKASWVYYEEIFNRSGYKAFWWSPASKHIAFLRFDEHKVPRYPILHVNPQGADPSVQNMSYPRAGENNPTVKLGLASAEGGDVAWVDLKAYDKEPILVIRADWLPDGKTAYFYVQDRAQTWLDVCTVPAAGGVPTKLLRDTTKAWVEDPGKLRFLNDGSFLLFSERTGYKHLYHYTAKGKLIRAVTEGPWQIRTLYPFDEKTGWLYFTGTKDGHLGSNFYRIKLDGSGLTRLTKGAGTHTIQLNAKGEEFTDSWSSHNMPPQRRLYKLDGTLIRELDPKPGKKKGGQVELVQIPTQDGFLLDGLIIKPANFDPTKKYPVWFTTYGGPHAPQIRDVWGIGSFDQNKANQGYIIFKVDPRSASGRGAITTWTAYRQLGVQELKDIETAILWLTKNPWADAERVGFTGYSYGGFMVAYAMTHSKVFSCGIAGAPVTDWRHYDSIYTERYMDTPQANPKGYDDTSVVKAAKNLHGKLLLVHGLIDDNVHARNTLQLAYELQRANKDFEMMIYPRDLHGISYGGAHFQRLTTDFMRRNLRPGSADKKIEK